MNCFRANHPRLPGSPIELFSIAESANREIDLSEAFRDFRPERLRRDVCRADTVHQCPPKGNLQRSVRPEPWFALRQRYPALDIVVELHESAATDIERLRQLANQLARMDIRFAYDDFGAGARPGCWNWRTPAHFVKFDRALIRDLHKATERKQQLVRDLVKMVLAAGSVPLAEGVEDEAEAAVCIDMGFQLIQGISPVGRCRRTACHRRKTVWLPPCRRRALSTRLLHTYFRTRRRLPLPTNRLSGSMSVLALHPEDVATATRAVEGATEHEEQVGETSSGSAAHRRRPGHWLRARRRCVRRDGQSCAPGGRGLPDGCRQEDELLEPGQAGVEIPRPAVRGAARAFR